MPRWREGIRHMQDSAARLAIPREWRRTRAQWDNQPQGGQRTAIRSRPRTRIPGSPADEATFREYIKDPEDKGPGHQDNLCRYEDKQKASDFVAFSSRFSMPTGKRSKRFGLAPPASSPNLVVLDGLDAATSTTTTPAPRRRACLRDLPSCLYGFRPFFLFGAIYAGSPRCSCGCRFSWRMVLLRHSRRATGTSMRCCTATCRRDDDRLPVHGDPELDPPVAEFAGRPLLTLVLVWIAGRVAVRREITPTSCRSARWTPSDRVADFSGSQQFDRPVNPLCPRPGGAGCGRSVLCPGRTFKTMDGSSMATPHVAGLAAFQTHSKLELPAVSKSWVNSVRRRATVVRISESASIAIPRCTKR